MPFSLKIEFRISYSMELKLNQNTYLSSPLLSAILGAVSGSRPRADVAYCIHTLTKRLAKTHSWVVCFLASCSKFFFFSLLIYLFLTNLSEIVFSLKSSCFANVNMTDDFVQLKSTHILRLRIFSNFY